MVYVYENTTQMISCQCNNCINRWFVEEKNILLYSCV